VWATLGENKTCPALFFEEVEDDDDGDGGVYVCSYGMWLADYEVIIMTTTLVSLLSASTNNKRMW